MQQKVIPPFAGKPATSQFIDQNGNLAYLVEPRFLTPGAHSAVNFLTNLGGVAAVLYGLVSVASSDKPTFDMLVGAMVTAAIATFFLKGVLESSLRKHMRFMLTKDRFSVRTAFGWKHYDRKLPHRFVKLPHDLTRAEQERQDFEAQKAQLAGKPYRKQRLYGASFHICLEYVQERIDLMTVFGEKDTVAILSRLDACDGVLEALLHDMVRERL